MDYAELNLKENSPSVSEALAILDINFEIYKNSGVKVVKIIHGYGSHGVGGAICLELRRYLRQLKNQNKIKDYLYGDEWDISNEKCFQILTSLSAHYWDKDLNHKNPGITIVVL